MVRRQIMCSKISCGELSGKISESEKPPTKKPTSATKSTLPRPSRQTVAPYQSGIPYCSWYGRRGLGRIPVCRELHQRAVRVSCAWSGPIYQHELQMSLMLGVGLTSGMRRVLKTPQSMKSAKISRTWLSQGDESFLVAPRAASGPMIH